MFKKSLITTFVVFFILMFVAPIVKNKTRILVTHAIDFIHKADKIIYMETGKII